MTPALFFLSACLACLVYWGARRLPLPPEPVPPRRPSLLAPVEAWLQRELDQAGLRASGRLLLQATVFAAGAGALVAVPFANLPLLIVCGLVFGAWPLQMVRARTRRRVQAMRAAVEPALTHIARLCAVRRHPFLALTDAVPLLAPPLKAEFELALSQCQAGLPLPDALRALAARCGGDFSLHQLAELVAINVREGGDLAGSLERLAARLGATAELRAEAAAKLSGYKWLTRILLAVTLAPLPYWAVTRSPSLQLYLVHPLAKALLVWVVVSGLAAAFLPHWLAVEE